MLRLFERKGFDKPQEFALGAWKLLLYRKILLKTNNFVLDDEGWSLFVCGTVVYRRLGYSDSLRRLLTDFRTGNLDQDELIGGFCLLFWDKRTISILLDRSRIFHVFDNETRTCLSSSFLAVLDAALTPLTLNRLALAEKLTTGYIVAPDTLVDGIRQLDANIASEYSAENDKLRFLPVFPRPPVVLHGDGLADSIARQKVALEHHFRSMDALHVEASGELGLSSGYDSRLVLACAKFLSRPMAIHTHHTIGAHDKESKLAGEIAATRNLAFTKIPTQKISEHTLEAVAIILADGLLFYDGRCSHNMGAFSETYTRAYKSKVLGECRLGWNGLGGEMYRNYYFTADSITDQRQWFDRHVYYPFASDALGDAELYEAMHRHKMEKLARRLGESPSDRVDYLWLRRYYTEVRMPDCDATNNDALNQLAFFHTPFMDAILVAEALGATRYIGCDGSYQGRLIYEIDSDLAAFMTHYGHTLPAIPKRVMIRSWLRGRIPKGIQNRRLRAVLRRTAARKIAEHNRLEDRVPMLREIREALCTTIVKGNYDDAMIDYAQQPTTVFVGSFLCTFQHKIRW